MSESGAVLSLFPSARLSWARLEHARAARVLGSHNAALCSVESGIDLRDFVETQVRITSRFDDPAAQDCQYTEDHSHLNVLPADAVVGCRKTFVVTDIALTQG